MEYPCLSKRFWEKVKNNDYWSGVIVDTNWDDLYEEERKEIDDLFCKAVKTFLEDL